jgi:hypothetical protein
MLMVGQRYGTDGTFLGSSRAVRITVVQPGQILAKRHGSSVLRQRLPQYLGRHMPAGPWIENEQSQLKDHVRTS